MATMRDWASVLFLASMWAAGMLTWGYFRRRRYHARPLRTVPRSKHLGVYAATALLGLDFGLPTRFGLHCFRGIPLAVLVGTNMALVAIVLGLRLLRPPAPWANATTTQARKPDLRIWSSIARCPSIRTKAFSRRSRSWMCWEAPLGCPETLRTEAMYHPNAHAP